MIAYEELVAALTNWRANQGLPTGATDFLGAPPVPPPVDVGHAESVSEYAADDMVIEDEQYNAAHLHTGDSTDAVDVSEIEVLSDEVYHEQPVAPAYEEAPAAFEEAPAAFEEAPAAFEEAPAAFEEAPAAFEEAPVAYEEAPAAFEAAPAAYEEAPVAYEEAPVAYSEPPPLSYEEPAPEDATMVAGMAGEIGGVDDEATRVADDLLAPPPVVDLAPADGRQTVDTEINPIIAESDLPAIPSASGDAARSDSTIDIDLGADVLAEEPVVSGELGGTTDPKPE